jgi:uroporphyrinogen III methyltransferase/synthase
MLEATKSSKSLIKIESKKVDKVGVKKGMVYLVGAGPGRADLITVRGAEVLGLADCIIYDKLANPALLRFARKDAEIIHVPKRIGKGSFTQDQINALLIEKALAGKTVVRLKGGDPCIFGRCSEEITLLTEAGVDFEVVPGVTAAIAAAEYTGIILTDREYSSQVVFVTGREAEGKQDSNIDWHWLAKFSGTIVFYMGMGNLGLIAEKLIANGTDKNTPTSVIADATFPSQRLVKAPLEQINQKCKAEQIEPPAIIVIGASADSDERFNWFMKKPLFGKNIVVTRDQRGNAEFAAKIISRGGNPIELATFEIKPLTQTNQFLEALSRFSKYDWIIFTSRNGVSVFFEALQKLGKDARVFGSAKVAVIGDETATTLTGFGIKPDFVPGIFTSRELARHLTAATNLHGKKILLLRSQLASKELVELLQQVGAQIEDVAVYTAAPQQGDYDSLADKIRAGYVHWLTFASPSSAKVFFEHVRVETVNSSNAKIASIGPVTSEQLTSLSVRTNVTATKHTFDGLLDAIENTCK